MKALWLRFLDWFSSRFGIGRTPVPREPVSFRPIAVVRTGVKESRPDGWEHVRSTIIVRADLADGLDGIDGYTHIIVIFAFDKVPESEQRLRVRMTADERIPEQGVLATRSQRRPNPLGVSVVRLQRRRGNVLWVEGQGSALHPGSTAWIALLRGSMPTDLVLVHRPGQVALDGLEHIAIPPLPEVIALYEADVPFEQEIVDLQDPDARERFVRMTPLGKFPVIVDEAAGKAFPESTIVIEYLASKYPAAARLLPADPDLALRVRLSDRFYDLYIHDKMQRILPHRYTDDLSGFHIVLFQVRGDDTHRDTKLAIGQYPIAGDDRWAIGALYRMHKHQLDYIGAHLNPASR